MNPYEILLLLDPDLPEEGQTEIVERVRENVERGGGTWERQEPWGGQERRRRMRARAVDAGDRLRPQISPPRSASTSQCHRA